MLLNKKKKKKNLELGLTADYIGSQIHLKNQ